MNEAPETTGRDQILDRQPNDSELPVSSSVSVGIDEELLNIALNADVDALPHPAGRLRILKRAILRAAGFNWVRQRAVNRSLLAAQLMTIERTESALDELRKEVAVLHVRLETSERGVEQELAVYGKMMDRLSASNEKAVADLDADLHEILAQHEKAVADLGADLHEIFAQQAGAVASTDDQLRGLLLRVGRLESISWFRQRRSQPRDQTPNSGRLDPAGPFQLDERPHNANGISTATSTEAVPGALAGQRDRFDAHFDRIDNEARGSADGLRAYVASDPRWSCARPRRWLWPR